TLSEPQRLMCAKSVPVPVYVVLAVANAEPVVSAMSIPLRGARQRNQTECAPFDDSPVCLVAYVVSPETCTSSPSSRVVPLRSSFAGGAPFQLSLKSPPWSGASTAIRYVRPATAWNVTESGRVRDCS